MMNQTVVQLPGQGQPKPPYEELEQQLHSALSYIEDLHETNTYLEERDRQHLQKEADHFEELRELAQKDYQIIRLKKELQDALTQGQDAAIAQIIQERDDLRETCRRHNQKDVYTQEYEQKCRSIRRLDYTQMTSSSKLVALDYLEEAYTRHPDMRYLTEPFNVIVSQVAERVGLSPSQMTEINKTGKKSGAWSYNVDRKWKAAIGKGKDKKDIYDCEVTVTLDKLVNAPGSIEKPLGKKGAYQGGGRVKTCRDCGSDDMDDYGLEYCRSCKKAHIRFLPGIRSDANILEAVQAVKENRVTIDEHIYQYSQSEDDDQDQKHHAFSPDDLAEIEEELVEQTQDPMIATKTEQKQDAFSLETTLELARLGERINRDIIPFPSQDNANSQKQDAFSVTQPLGQDETPQIDKETEQKYQRWDNAGKLLQQLLDYGFELEYLPDGRHLRHTDKTPSTIIEDKPTISNLKRSIKQYDEELRELVANQHPIDQKQDAFNVPQPTGQGEQVPAPQIVKHTGDLQPFCNMPSRENTIEEYRHLAPGTRVDTPVGLAIVTIVSECPILHRPRCAVRTDRRQPDGTRLAAFDLSQVQPIKQGVLL